MLHPPQLFLIPTPLGKTPANNSLPPDVIRQIHELDTFFVESIPSARSFLQWIEHPVPEYELKLYLLNKKTSPKEIPELLETVMTNGRAGMFSEAGAPAVADPGAELVRQAHKQGIIVTPLVGPSSITLALMASGGNGQQFTFHGYLPRNSEKLKKELNRIEKSARSDGYTHLFMETPHRTPQLWKELLATLQPDTYLGIGQNLTLPAEYTSAKEVMMWQVDTPEMPADPAIFFIYRNPETRIYRKSQSFSRKKKNSKKGKGRK